MKSALLYGHLAVLLLLAGLLNDGLELHDLLFKRRDLLLVDLEQLVVVDDLVHARFVLNGFGSLGEPKRRKRQVDMLHIGAQGTYYRGQRVAAEGRSQYLCQLAVSIGHMLSGSVRQLVDDVGKDKERFVNMLGFLDGVHATFGKTFRASQIHQIKHGVFCAIAYVQFLVQLVNRHRGVKEIFLSHFLALFRPVLDLDTKYGV